MPDHRDAELHADIARLREALEAMLHAFTSETGFCAAVRAHTNTAYPWEPGDIAEAKARKALEARHD